MKKSVINFAKHVVKVSKNIRKRFVLDFRNFTREQVF